MSEKETYQELSDLRAQALELVQKYNRLAKNSNTESRLALLDAELYYDDVEKPEDIDKYVSDNYGEGVSLSCDAPEAYAWFPSSFCYGY